MADVIVKALKNGPYEVSGGAKLVDHTGKEYAESAIDPLYLQHARRYRLQSRRNRRLKKPNAPSLQHSNWAGMNWSIGVLE